MDLFGDLPPPTNDGGALGKTLTSDSKQTPSGAEKQGDQSFDLFGDLAPPDVEERLSEKRKLEEEKNENVSKKKRETGIKFNMTGFVAERKGEREDMQDAHVIINNLLCEADCKTPSEICRLGYYAVFDGHAGHRASQFAAEHLHKNILQKFPKGMTINRDREIKKCLIDAYKKTDDDFLQEAAKATPVLKDGSTAVSVLVVDDVLYVANLGDSKALLCRCDESGKTSVVPLSKDHSPTQYDERMRLQRAGGNVRDGRVLGVLEVSRSIGDGRFKRCGVIATPDVMRCTLTNRDQFLLLACDGLWKGFTVDAAIKYINNILQDESIQPESGENEKGKPDKEILDPVSFRFETACNMIASDAIRNGSSDNVTVMLVRITQEPVG